MNENDLLVKRIVFKEIVPGDIRKLQAQSNDANTGGGARDFRFKPQDIFYEFFEKMFINKNEKGVLFDKFYWYENEKVYTTDAEIYPPTNTRPNEVRLSKVSSCIPATVIPQSTESSVFLIMQRGDNTLWPYFISIDSLKNDDWDEMVKSVIFKALAAHRRENTSAMGYYDFETGKEYYYEQ